ncbi:FtsK/SpoIIIE domain-containing protein [Microbacterium sp. 2FI]|uniref:FtsK/SpoIIIE domain-containing protein n=1 Tax=Microbacterium sp. 2FI TaxID=2502193 RepID=UPI0010F94241|nr:FtsK/SpoIIIE domain-containing protein [Microbacterium sp. 2FI]
MTIAAFTPTHAPSLLEPVEAADTEPLVLPAAWTPPPRPGIPIMASIVPVIGAVALWLVMGSTLALWLALLGPLIAVATLLDAGRGARRARRIADAAAKAERARVSDAIVRRHDLERRRRWTRHPDVSGFALRSDEIWRPVPTRGVALVIGAGEVASALRVTGGEGDADAAALRARAARLALAPVTVPAADGVVIVGSPVLSAAVQRALALQLCLAHAPGDLRIVGTLGPDLAWAEELPHRRATSGLRLALVGRHDPVPDDADIALAVRAPGDPLPPRCATVLTVDAPERARALHHGEAAEVSIEAIAREQATAIAAELASRAERTLGWTRNADGPIALGPLLASSPADPGDGLPAVVGVAAGAPVVIDLVADGPHAVVTGVTGSGKSELLLTWIVALCATRSTREVTFLLADFKGGTAFDPLAGLPHVTGVITDLDGAGARRAIESLRAEVRWREAEIARVGARDIRDPRVRIPRLVIVVDEFAALLGDHPELNAVFADIAARGRALGMHLVLGTQRAAGVIRESVLANCPLRVSLRVADAADSRLVIGTDEAAQLPGGAAGRGLAMIRRAGDAEARRVTVALSDAADIAAIEAVADDAPRRPWLAPLPSRLPLERLRAASHEEELMLLGLSDEPEHQRQVPVGLRIHDRGLLVVGAAGSGKTNALAVLASQAPGMIIRIPRSAEGAWDAVAALVDAPPDSGTLVLIDDLDALPGLFPPDHAHAFLERLESIVRTAGAHGVLVAASAQRLAGPVMRLAELLPRRVLLALPTRSDHVAAGGDPAHFVAGPPPGRARFDSLAVQIALVAPAPPSSALQPRTWAPTGALTGLVTRRSPAARAAQAEWEASGVRVLSVDDYAAADPPADSRVVVFGEPDDWQRNWRILAEVRGDHDLVVDSSCAAELRVLAGSRTIPPYCEPGRARAWLLAAGAEPVRIVLPG